MIPPTDWHPPLFFLVISFSLSLGSLQNLAASLLASLLGSLLLTLPFFYFQPTSSPPFNTFSLSIYSHKRALKHGCAEAS